MRVGSVLFRLVSFVAAAGLGTALIGAGGSKVVSGKAAIPVSIHVDAARTLGPMRPVWRFFGCDEPNYATMPEGRRLMGELGKLRPRDTFFRTHNLLTSGDGKPALKWG